MKRFFNLIGNILSVVAQLPPVKKALQSVLKPPAGSAQGKAGVAQADPSPHTAESKATTKQAATTQKSKKPEVGTQQLAKDITLNQPSASSPLQLACRAGVDQGYLMKPAAQGLPLLIEPHAQQVCQMLQQMSGVVDAALHVTASSKAAFEFLLARNIDLSSEDIDSLMKARNMPGRSLTANALGPTPPAKPVQQTDQQARTLGRVTALVQAALLNVVFGVDLTANINEKHGWQGWMSDEHAAERTQEVYNAVLDITRAVSAEMKSGSLVKGILQFRKTFRGTEFELVHDHYKKLDDQGKEIQAPEDEKAYASTSDAPMRDPSNPRPPKIFLYTEPEQRLQEDTTRDFVLHTQENIVHEFGHSLIFLTSHLDDSMKSVWGRFSREINPPPTKEGWSNDSTPRYPENPTYRQNLSSDPDEMIADMYLYWVYSNGRGPGDDADNYYFTTAPEQGTVQTRRRASAMHTFIFGGSTPTGDPDLGIRLGNPDFTVASPGIEYWIEEAAKKNLELKERK